MTREQYIVMRDGGNFNIVYEYYKEKFDHSKHKPFLSIFELPQMLLATGYGPNQLLDKCIRYYDEKFNLVHLLDKNGNLIKTL